MRRVGDRLFEPQLDGPVVVLVGVLGQVQHDLLVPVALVVGCAVEVADGLALIGILAPPYVPGSAEKLLDLLAVPAGQRSFADLGTRLVPGAALPAPSPIFPRYVEEGESSPKA